MSIDLADRRLEDVVSKRAAQRLRLFRRDAEAAMPGQIADVVLFGSRARGDARRDSDYDVAVFVRNLADPRAANHQFVRLTHEHLLAGYHINALALPVGYLDTEGPGTLRFSIARDGVEVR